MKEGFTIIKKINLLEELIDSINSFEFHYSLEIIFKDDNNLENLINYYLEKIRNTCNIENINNLSIKSNSISKHFDYNYVVSDNDIIKNNSNIIEEAEIISDDLIYKVLGRNNRYISLPISLNNICNYSISNYINDKDINKVIYWIILKLAIIYYLSK